MLPANAADSLASANALQSTTFVESDANSMSWPLMPSESLNDVARLFYPKDKQMQQKFVLKTLRLSTEIQPNLRPSDRFESPTLCIIPTLKSLSNSTHKIHSGSENPKLHRLKLSYEIEQIPAKLMRDYELLLSKNAFLKAELAKLNEKIVFLQAKLKSLKLIWDKTLHLPNTGQLGTPPLEAAQTGVTQPSPAAAGLPSNALPTEQQANKKVFKNLNAQMKAQENSSAPEARSFIDYFNTDLVKAALALGLLGILSALLLKKYRERMFQNLSFVATKMQNTVQEVGGYIQTRLDIKQETTPELAQEAHAAKQVEARQAATLEEAKLLMSINRTTDAIAHLKMTIEAQPKASINHWLYLLEIFRKLNLKEDFEKYAADMHQTLNVMTPVWYETEIAMVVPQSLEEFPHIMEKLYSIWPGDLATLYLRGLITDNRGGERTGFGKAVLSEILMLIELLDVRKELN